eukprot:TCALIF_06830-PA protein Name:"Protein of unknown function" AED:0.41 eAED:0.41 QI:0/-1/0/1/-1/1/1/0/100
MISHQASMNHGNGGAGGGLPGAQLNQSQAAANAAAAAGGSQSLAAAAAAAAMAAAANHGTAHPLPNGAAAPLGGYNLANIDMTGFQAVDWTSMYGMGMYV